MNNLHRSIPTILASISAFGVATVARGGGCTGWRAGPFLGNNQTNGLSDWLSHVCTWDPDGAGPQQPVLAVCGDLIPDSNVTGCIVTYNSVTNTWQQIGACAPGERPRVMTTFNNDLVVGGNLTSINALPLGDLVRYNGSAWQSMGLNTSHGVFSLTEMNGDLIAGTDYQTYLFGQPIGPIWSWLPPDDWNALTSLFTFLSPDDYVRALTYFEGDLIAQVIDPIFGGSLVCWFSGQTITAPISVRVLQGFSGDLIMAGYCDPPYNGIARYDGAAFHPMGAGFDYSFGYGWVECLAVYNGQLIAGGHFDTSAGDTVNHVARWDGAAWQPLGEGVNGDVLGLAVYNGQLYAVGDFSMAGGVAANNIARWNGSAWSPIVVGNAFTNVMAMTTLGSRVVAGGTFQQVTAGGATANNIAVYDGMVASTFGAGANGPVRALTNYTTAGPLASNVIVAAGDFSQVFGDGLNPAAPIAAIRVARWTESQTGFDGWSAMGAGFNNSVYALERFNGETVAGGAFTTSGATPTPYLARFTGNPASWQPFGALGLNSYVYALKRYFSTNGDENLVVGGAFTTATGIGPVAANHVLQLTQTILGGSWADLGAGFNGSVYTIERYGNGIQARTYAAGAFTMPGSGLYRVARFTGSPGAWEAVGVAGPSGGFNNYVDELKSAGGYLYAAGDFTSVDGIPCNRLARWNGSVWEPVEGGTDGSVFALASYNGEIHAGGAFTAVNNATRISPGWAKYQSTGVPWIAYQPAGATRDCFQDFQAHVQVASGYDGLAFQWRRNGTPLSDGPTPHGSTISGAFSPSLSIDDVRTLDAGDYTCVANNACGSVTSAAATLTVTGNCCPADIAPIGAPDGSINVSDLLGVINGWGACVAPCPPECAADINDDCQVSVIDLLAVINAWGPCP